MQATEGVVRKADMKIDGPVGRSVGAFPKAQ